MLCPYCNFNESNVLESREAEDNKATRRRRECLKCKKRFTTYERVENISLKVIKKSGRIEDYSRAKLERCMEKACWRMTEEEREKIIDEIEMKLLNWQEVEIPSKEIGKMIMEKLKKVDQMAYIRFATVYLDFNSINDFEKLLVDLKNNG
ncbi:MAG TPA: transcriptional regulator NrdR [Candidatus Woesebacteria bacterium]|jgi:transcriptional repressor NrdR|nr:transcriptional repressor NrdR [Candidatus Shapirobacteria bacterium]HOR02120.1 transcriptional regulator NrdR [Candidatus Woesebacteria bacterium]